MDYTKITKKDIKERDDICTVLPVGGKVFPKKCRDNITYFCYHQLGITPYTWQHVLFREVMKNNEDILACTPRQVGKSFADAVIALHHSIYNILPVSSKGNRTIIGIVSKSEGQAKKLMDDINTLIDTGDMHLKRKYGLKYGWFSAHKSSRLTDSNNKLHITFRKLVGKIENKKKVYVPEGDKIGEIICVPATESARGYTFSKVIMDEAAFFEMEDFYSTIAEPTMRSTKGHSIVTTTPNGQRGWFFKSFDPFDEHEENSYYRMWLHYDHIESQEEREAVLVTKLKLEQSGESKKFQQEYEASFTADGQAFFDAEKVDMMMDKTESRWDSYSKPCDLGVDIGFKRSRSVLTVTRLDDDKIIRRIWNHRYNAEEDLTIVEDIIALIPKYNIQRVIVDDCAAAGHLIQALEKAGVNVKLMSFKKDKVKKYVQFRAKMYQGKIVSYDDKQLAAEMKAMEEEETPRSTRIACPKGGSDDSIDSFVISSFFFLEEKAGFKIYEWDEE